MSLRIAVQMDPLESVKTAGDTSLMMIEEAQARGHRVFVYGVGELSCESGRVRATARAARVFPGRTPHAVFEAPASIDLRDDVDVVLMRQDPPFHMGYITACHLLELVAPETLVVNDPRSIRDASEKLFTAWFADVCPPTLVTRNMDELRAFLHEHHDIVVKPLDGMGGASVFRVRPDDGNASVIFETITELEQRYCMAQRYLPAILEGDKRILVVDGEPLPYSLARIPASGELRGNLAAGGRGVPQPLTASDRAIAERVAPELKKRGLIFVGLDVIGDRLTEINVTSPTCAREIEAQYDIDIGGLLMQAIEKRLTARR